MKDGGHVYPFGNPMLSDSTKGMTMRQYYKAAALTGILCSELPDHYYQPDEGQTYAEKIAEVSSNIADVMIAEDKEHSDG